MNRGKRSRKNRRRNPLWLACVLAVPLLAAALVLSHQTAPGPVEAIAAPSSVEKKLAKPDPIPEKELAEEILETMSLREKLCQLFIVMPTSLTGEKNPTAANETLQKALETWPVGGLLYDKTNLISQEQTRNMLSGTMAFSKIPLLFTCDEEGGRVNRLMETIGTTWVDSMLSYKDKGTETASKNAQVIGTDLVSCGFNMDFAPVADVWSNPKNKVIGDRAYSDDFQQAAELVSAAVKGFHSGGVACTLKHFPGHGDTSADTHFGSVYVYKTLDQLRQNELLPFKAGIDAGADAVMMGHLIVKDVEDCPALFSHKLVTEVLRGELGFDGVVLSDSLQMKAMTDHYSSGEIALSAIQAGVDVLLSPLDLEDAVNTLTEAVEKGTLSEARIDESVLRVLRLKERTGLLKNLDRAALGLPPKEMPKLLQRLMTVIAARKAQNEDTAGKAQGQSD